MAELGSITSLAYVVGIFWGWVNSHLYPVLSFILLFAIRK